MFSGFKIERLPSIYNNKTVLNEYIPDNRLNALIQHNIGIEFSENQYQRKHYNFTNELAYSIRYWVSIIKKIIASKSN